jgi:membrane fusion protein
LDDMGGLYRGEALSAAQSRFGNPAKLFGVKSWALVAFLCALTLSASLFITLAQYARKETVVGLVVPTAGVERVAALKAGVIRSVLIHSGDKVTADQPLFILSYDSVLEGGAGLSERLDVIMRAQLRSTELQNQFKKQQIAQSQAEANAQLKGLEAEVVRLQEQQELQYDRVALLEKDYNAALKLIERQYISELQLAQKRDSWLQSRQTLLQVEQNLGQTQSRIEQLHAQIKGTAIALSATAADLSLDRARFDEKQVNNQSSDSARIVAHRDGLLTNIQVRAGDVVTPGQTLALIVPGDRGKPSQVNLWVPSRAIGFVQMNTPVRLMFDAFPYQTFGIGRGRVVDVSSAPLMPGELPVPIKTDQQMYKIVVALDRDELTAYGRNWPLRPGMRLTADLVLEEKSFLDWLLDPLLASRQRAGA